MKKKALIILLSLTLTGCGSTNHVELSNPTTEPASTIEETTSIETCLLYTSLFQIHRSYFGLWQ